MGYTKPDPPSLRVLAPLMPPTNGVIARGRFQVQEVVEEGAIFDQEDQEFMATKKPSTAVKRGPRRTGKVGAACNYLPDLFV